MLQQLYNDRTASLLFFHTPISRGMDQLQALLLDRKWFKKPLPSLGEVCVGSSQKFSHVNGRDVFGVGGGR